MIFTIPWTALLGGMLLGLSAALLMLFSGKVAGISGIVAGVINPQKEGASWKAAFFVGMVLSLFIIQPFGFSLPDVAGQNMLLVVIAGLCVGFGTRLGNGCTSGHGIVGVGRFSKRSIVATVVFIVSAMIVVFIRQTLGGL